VSDQYLNLVDVRLRGVFELQAIKNVLQSIVTHSDWEPGKSIIFDYSDLDFTGFSSEDMRLVSDMVVQYKNSFGSGKWAFIISNDLQFGLMRMWEMITEDRVPMVIALFKNRPAAHDWISKHN
jgi:hypothetical protein